MNKNLLFQPTGGTLRHGAFRHMFGRDSKSERYQFDLLPEAQY